VLLNLLKNAAYGTLRRLFAIADARRQPPNCILILQAMLPLGGCVHATPLFGVLHDEMPEYPVYVATRGLGIEVLRHNANIAGLLEIPDVFGSLRGAGGTLSRSLRRQGLRPAWVVLDASNPRTQIALLGLFFARAPLIGFSLAGGLQKIALQRNPALSMIQENLSIAKALGLKAEHREPDVFVGMDEVERARALLQGINPGQKPMVIFSTQPSGGQPTEWHADRWSAVLAAVAERGLLPVFVGTANQSAAIDRLRSLTPSVASESLAGKTDVPTLAAVLALADLCMSIDTGTLHVARAARVPCIALAPTFQSPIEWLPLGVPTARVLRGEHTAPAPPGYRLDEIEVPQVIAAMDELLGLYPPSAGSRKARAAAMTTNVNHLLR
jgi:ADP-heptose:LPS heptosyltransferase